MRRRRAATIATILYGGGIAFLVLYLIINQGAPAL